MKATIKITKEVELKTLLVSAGVRYWEDGEVNGETDTVDGDNIPCKSGDNWCPEIDINTGIITNWTKGVTASVHYKVCDCCSWQIKDEEGNIVVDVDDEYVPGSLSPADSGYGDYIIMEIDADGQISDWDFNPEDFIKND